jgi:hypothetical protein
VDLVSSGSRMFSCARVPGSRTALAAAGIHFFQEFF